MNTIYIHGATATNRSFAYIQKSLRAPNPTYLNYGRNKCAEDNLMDMIAVLDKTPGELFFITHSLGGIYAVRLQERFRDRTRGVVSLATPFNGSEIATWGRFMNPGYQLFKDIAPSSDFIKVSKRTPITVPWTQYVTTTGDVPWLMGANDGIVTRTSMICRSDVHLVDIDRNHYEIVLSKRVVAGIKNLMNVQDQV